ncbi:MAG TPA: hypothetical protein VGQ89_05825, partial [Candidatus Limnocylindrales bacterium]|nr:hypothetical protein [Candidatus Limnocylindrales bacterium]
MRLRPTRGVHSKRPGAIQPGAEAPGEGKTALVRTLLGPSATVRAAAAAIVVVTALGVLVRAAPASAGTSPSLLIADLRNDRLLITDI